MKIAGENVKLSGRLRFIISHARLIREHENCFNCESCFWNEKKEINMKTFWLYWLTGKSEKVAGTDAADAMNRAGYGAGAVRALDFYQEGETAEYEWIDGQWKAV